MTHKSPAINKKQRRIVRHHKKVVDLQSKPDIRSVELESGESTMTKTMQFLALFLTLALMVASAATYNVTLFQPSFVGGKELKAGDYKLTVEGDKAILSMGKQKVEAAAKITTADTRFSSTSVRYVTEDGKMKITEIRLGGTNQKLIFN
jgi:hypothetical protein